MENRVRTNEVHMVTIPFYTMVTTFISYFILIAIGHIRDFFGKMLYPCYYRFLLKHDGMEPLYTDFESFYVRRLYGRICDCWNRPITGVPGKILKIIERKWNEDKTSFHLTGNIIEAMNIGSYNYLGLASNQGVLIETVIESLKKYPVNYPGTTLDLGRNKIVRELEIEMADFVHKEDCIVFPMGFGTNSCNIPVIMGKGCLILSDELNHTSIVYGSQMSDAVKKTFSHNNMKDLETKLRYHITQGQPITHKAWKKIFVIVEGIYSMEGTILKLKKIVELKRKYKFYIFIDEAHSIGALGKTGRGVCEYLDVDFDDVDILMGTFTKTFGGSGGYIAASKKIVDYLRLNSDFSLYGEQVSPCVVSQTLEALKILKYSEEGLKLTKNLNENAIYFRKRLTQLGYVVFGDFASPIIPLMIFNPGKIASFSNMCLERKLAVVVVGYPATPVLSSRVRFCLSAAHTRDDIDAMIRIIDYCGRKLGMNIIK